MLGHFPSPHPDELLYGVRARLSERANVPSKKGFCQTLFGAASIAVVDLPSRLEFLAKQLPSGGPNAETLLRNHTLLPLYLPFLPKERAEKCKQAALGDGGKSLPFLTGVMASKIVQPTNLRLCPLCAAEDTRAYGEPYWHRSHQIAGLPTCYRHGVLLLETPTRRGSRLNRHEFHCPPKTQQDIDAPYTEGDGRLHIDAHWLLNRNDFEPGLDLLKVNYLVILQEKRLGCPLSTDQNSSWLADMLRDRPRCAHPIQHLLLINFLGHTAQSFFEILVQERKKPKCAATPPQKETRQKEIDQKVLARLWEDRQISLREISRQLKVDPNVNTYEIGAAQVRVLEIGFPQIRTSELRFLEAGLTEIRLT
jgi:TniQ protein/Tn7-like transposition protein D